MDSGFAAHLCARGCLCREQRGWCLWQMLPVALKPLRDNEKRLVTDLLNLLRHFCRALCGVVCYSKQLAWRRYSSTGKPCPASGQHEAMVRVVVPLL